MLRIVNSSVLPVVQTWIISDTLVLCHIPAELSSSLKIHLPCAVHVIRIAEIVNKYIHKYLDALILENDPDNVTCILVCTEVLAELNACVLLCHNFFKSVNIFSDHSYINIVIPRNESVVSDSTDQRSKIKPVWNVMLITYSSKLLEKNGRSLL